MSKAPPKLKKKQKVQMGPLWDWTSGITQSSIESFLACREQFALGYIEGWTPRAFSTPLEFGSIFHFMLEKIGTDSPDRIAREVTKSYHDTRKKTLDGVSYDALQLTLTNAQVLFPIYVEYYKEADSKYHWLQREHIFRVPHKFTNTSTDFASGKIEEVVLTGMRDGEYRTEAGHLGLFETKTKSTIDDLAIQDGLRADLQTMFYLYALQREYKETPKQILYNVVRRPQLRIKTSESYDDYGKRVEADIRTRPDWYFRRFEVSVSQGDIEVFLDTTLDPILRLMYQWWDSIRDNPFDRWASPFHFRSLPALMNRYGKAALYNLMIRNRENEYYRRSSPFPELKESPQLQEA